MKILTWSLWVSGALVFLTGVFTVACVIAVITWYSWAVYQTFGIAGSIIHAEVSALQGLGRHLLPTRTLGDTSWGSGTNTFCETFVEQTTGIGNQGISAATAADRMRSLGILHSGEAPAGAIVYFAPSLDNGYWGHVGIADGGGKFTSITFYGLQQYALSEWQAPYVGYVLPGDIHSDRFGHRINS